MGMMVSRMLIGSALVSFLVTAVSGCFVIPALRRYHFGQSIREEGPTWHQKKGGTPTMGGLCFIFGILAAVGTAWIVFNTQAPELLGRRELNVMLLVLLFAFANGCMGFADDAIKVVKHHNEGLTEGQKLVIQFALSAAFLIALHSLGMDSTRIFLPFYGAVDIGIFYYPIAFLGLVFMVNAVNLTDGLDGLCSCITFVSMLGYLLAASLLSYYHVSLMATAVAGGCAGFLIWNFYPAKVFMGDTGSMFLGGMVAGLAFALNRPELVLFFGAVYIWDAMTVVIQRFYFKVTHGKRIFRMTPIHHAFELRGWSEIRIDGFFSLLAISGAALGVLYVYLL